MRVQATKQGFYDQVLREAGEVFDLLDNPDGTMPLRVKRTFELGPDGKHNGEYADEVWLDADGEAVHRDFAPDGEILAGKGNFRGENYFPGWMVQVPDSTPCGIYEPDVHFNMAGKEDKKPIQRIIKASNEPANMPRMAPMKGKVDRQRRAVQ